MTVRDIETHLACTLGVEVGRETIGGFTDAVLAGVTAWQTRPLDPVRPVCYGDALGVKVRDGAHVVSTGAHLVIGVDLDGVTHVLGICLQTGQGANFWASVCAELANRSVHDVLIGCGDGLTELSEAIEATSRRTVAQTGTGHLIRAAPPGVSPHRRCGRDAALAGHPRRRRPTRPAPPENGRTPARRSPGSRWPAPRRTHHPRLDQGPEPFGQGPPDRSPTGAVG